LEVFKRRGDKGTKVLPLDFSRDGKRGTNNLFGECLYTFGKDITGGKKQGWKKKKKKGVQGIKQKENNEKRVEKKNRGTNLRLQGQRSGVRRTTQTRMGLDREPGEEKLIIKKAKNCCHWLPAASGEKGMTGRMVI